MRFILETTDEIFHPSRVPLVGELLAKTHPCWKKNINKTVVEEISNSSKQSPMVMLYSLFICLLCQGKSAILDHIESFPSK